MPIPLEDGFIDVIAKAQRGLGVPDSVLAERAGVPLEAIKVLKEGQIDDVLLAKVAPVLRLSGPALIRLAHGKYHPEVAEMDGLEHFNTPFEDMTVNAYLLWDPLTRQAVVFDTGSDVTEMLYHVTARSLKVSLILLTHAHGDHIYDLDRLVEKTAAPVFAPARETVEETESFEPGRTFSVGGLSIRSVLTNGHSPGGTTYVVEGLSVPVAMVGDSLFAGSMGGAGTTWELALGNNRNKILTLPPETIVCPGHGPMTTVALERANNPFYP